MGSGLWDDLLKKIVIDPRVMAGKPVIRGTRITVDQVLELLAAGMIPEGSLKITG